MSSRKPLVTDVLSGEQRQGAHLGDRLSRGVGVHQAHAGQTAVQSDQQVETLNAFAVTFADRMPAAENL